MTENIYYYCVDLDPIVFGIFFNIPSNERAS